MTNNKTLFSHLAFFLSASLASLGHAQNDELNTIEETTVWGTAVHSNSLFLGDTDISIKQADHLSDLLRDIPGVDIGGTHSTNARINFRGLDDRDLSVYIDGASQKNYLYHHMGNLLVNADILKSAELTLGANSVVNDGLGGAIRFETKDARDLLEGDDARFGGRVMAGYNSNAQTSYSFTGYGQLSDSLDVLAYLNTVDRDNFEDGSGTETIGSDGTTDNILFKFGADITDDQRIELTYESIDDAGDYTQRPDMGVRTNRAITGDLLLPTEYERETINLGYEISSEIADVRFTAYTNDMYLWRDERASFTRTGPGTLREGEADNFGIGVFATSALDSGQTQHLLTYGLDYFDQDLSFVSDIAAGDAPVTEEGQTLALFIEDRIEFGERFALTPGVRYTDFEQSLASSNSDGSWDETTFALAGEFQVTDGLLLKASYTEIFKAPELAEVFVGGATDKVVNPNVNPENGDNIELGLRYSAALGEGKFNFGFNLFETTIDNYIGEANILDAEGMDTGLDWDVNLGTAVIDGVEASLNYAVQNWDFLLTYASSDLDTSGLNTDGGDSLRLIGDSFGIQVEYQLSENFLVNYNARYIASVTEVNGSEKPSYDVHNISAQWRDIAGYEGLSATVGIDNLFDEFYTSHASRNGISMHPVFGTLELNDVEPGQNIKATLSYSF